MKSYSQANQDLAALELFGENGTFLEVGSGPPINISNTYLLETEHGWSGVCIDAERYDYSVRTCDFMFGDALSIIPDLSGSQFDYASFDIDRQTAAAVQIAVNCLKFKFATVEHDKYQHGYVLQDLQHRVLSKTGYVPLFIDILTDEGKPFEDWWVLPEISKCTLGVGVNATDALNYIKALVAERL